MATDAGGIRVEGLKEFQSASRRAADRELPKCLGQAHRHIGELVISRLSPAPDPMAVGAGAGAAVRASASKRDVLLRVGGAHRASGAYTRMQPWGRTRVGRIGILRPARPHIRGTIDKYRSEIENAYLQAVSDAMSGAFAKTTP
jgi:hypothetical protein